jgi:hypothetical protein
VASTSPLNVSTRAGEGHEQGLVGRLLAGLHEESCTFQAASLAESTKRQYSYHVAYFAKFCVALGLEHEFAEPSETTVCLYCALLARSVKATTVRQYLKGLKDCYRGAGISEFADPAVWHKLYRQLKGTDRLKQSEVKKKLPITPGMLEAFARMCDPTSPVQAASVAMALIAFFGFFRKSNVSVDSDSVWSDGKCLKFSDITVDTKAYALRVVAPGSKTRQTGPAPAIYIGGMRGHPLDPVAWWCAHVAASGVPPDASMGAFAFLHPEHGERVPMRHKHVTIVAKEAAALVGADAREAGGHSFRRGGATWAFQQGVPEVLVQRQGDWRSGAYKEYIVLSREQALLTTDAMFKGMDVLRSEWRSVRMALAVDPGEHTVAV